MGCIKCGKDPEISMGHIGDVCKKCFLEIVGKRVRKGARQARVFKKGSKILFIDNSSKEFAVGYFLAKSIIEGLPVTISVKKSKTRRIPASAAKNYDKVIIPWSLDDEVEVFMDFVFSKKRQKRFSKKEVKLLECLSDEEIALFAGIKKLKYKKTKNKKTRIREIVCSLEQRYPGYKFSLLNSSAEMRKMEMQNI